MVLIRNNFNGVSNDQKKINLDKKVRSNNIVGNIYILSIKRETFSIVHVKVVNFHVVAMDSSSGWYW